MNYYSKYIKYKTKYLQLLNNQDGGKKKNKNMFLDYDYFYMHHNKKYRKQRLDDFNEIYNKLKKHLNLKDSASINKKRLKTYINLHKQENQKLIKDIIDITKYVSFTEFKKELFDQINRFNDYLIKNKIKKYIFTIGVGNDIGASAISFNIYKSNFWVFLLGYHLLKIKPYDICLNLNTAIRLYGDEITNYLIIDDCIYSGSQVVDNVLYVATTELMYDDDVFTNKNIIKTQILYKLNQAKKINIHLVVPYISKIALNKIDELNHISGFNIIKYTSYIVNPYNNLFNNEDLDRINNLYKQYYNYINFNELIPIFFEHKIADMVSTIDLILIKGQVLDNPEKKYVFIDSCIYNKNNPEKYDLDPNQPYFINKKLYCPIPPYLKFEEILKK